MFKREFTQANEIIQQHIQQYAPFAEPIGWLPTPFKGQWGFGSNVCFQVAAAEARSGKRVNVPQRAQEIAEALVEKLKNELGFARVAAESGYLNLYIDPGVYAQRVLEAVLDEETPFGKGEPQDERVMVEYSQPNTHKAFHVGHLRNVILGGSMSNILEYAGYDTVRANYIGDIGWHVIKWIWCYMRFHAGEEPQGDRTRWMQDIYAEATRLVEDNPEYEAEARTIFARWEANDPEIQALWETTRQWSLEGFDEIYDQPGSQFVADFIGLSDFIEGTILSVGAEKAVVAVDDLQFAVPASPKMQPREKLLFFIRPNDIDLFPPSHAGGENTFDGVVSKKTYLGDKVDYRIVVGRSLDLRVQTDGKVRFEQGESVCLQLPVDRCRAIVRG